MPSNLNHPPNEATTADEKPAAECSRPLGLHAVLQRLTKRAQATIGAPVERPLPSLEKELTPEQRTERERSKAELARRIAEAAAAIEAPAKMLPETRTGAGNLGSLFGKLTGGVLVGVDVRFDARDADRVEEARAGRRARAKAKQEARRARQDRNWIEGHVSAHTRNGVPPDAIPPHWQRVHYLMAQEIIADARAGEGRQQCKAQKWLERFSDRMPWLRPTLALIRDAALQPLPSGGFEYDFSDAQARRIVAEALALIGEAERTKKRGRFALIVKGFSINAIRALVHTPGNPDRRIHRNRIGGAGRKPEHARASAAAARWRFTPRRTAHRRDSATDLQRLRDAGFLYAQQLPSACVAVWECDTSKHVRNRYWIAIEGSDSDSAALAELGATFGDETIRTPLRAPPAPG